jgi:hypothetical protein
MKNKFIIIFVSVILLIILLLIIYILFFINKNTSVSVSKNCSYFGIPCESYVDDSMDCSINSDCGTTISTQYFCKENNTCTKTTIPGCNSKKCTFTIIDKCEPCPYGLICSDNGDCTILIKSCSNDNDCGTETSSITCSGNNLCINTVIPTCMNPRTNESRCYLLDKDNCSPCEVGQTCSDGKCN